MQDHDLGNGIPMGCVVLWGRPARFRGPRNVAGWAEPFGVGGKSSCHGVENGDAVTLRTCRAGGGESAKNVRFCTRVDQLPVRPYSRTRERLVSRKTSMSSCSEVIVRSFSTTSSSTSARRVRSSMTTGC